MKVEYNSISFKRKAILGLVGFLLFAQCLNDPFHFDDALILNDANIVNASNWTHFFNPFHLRELTYFTFYLNHLVAGTNPGTYHLINLALHVANALLLYGLLDGLFEGPLALISATIFLVHPIQTEAVMYVYQRSVLLACFFSLLALCALRKNRNWIALMLFFCAFESKESAVAVPLLVAIGYFLRDRTAKEPIAGPPAGAGWFRRPMVLFLAFTIIFAAAAIAILDHQQESSVGLGAMTQISTKAYVLTESRVVYTYLRLLVVPFPQSIEYDFQWTRTIDIHTLVQIAGLLLIVGIGVWLARSKDWRITGYAIIAFFILLAPTSTVIPSLDAAFEHRLYLPMLAFSIFSASIAVHLKHPFRSAAPVLGLLMIATLLRGSIWSSDSRLWEDAVQHAPYKARPWFNLGGAYLQSDPERAASAFHRAIALQPDFAEAYYDLGIIDQGKNNFRQAAEYFERTISLNRGYWPAWNNLGNALVSLGETERALQAFETTLRLNPDHWPSQYNIAIVHFNSGRFDAAIPRLRTVLDWRPDFRDARYLLAVALSRTGQRAEAESEWHKIGSNGRQPPMPTMIPTPAR